MHNLKKYVQSLALLEQIETELHNSRNLYVKLEIYGKLGHVHRHLHHYDNALTYYKESVQFAMKLGVEQQIVVLHEHAGQMYKETNQTELAELSFINALTHAEKDAWDSTIHHSKTNLAFFYIQQLEWVKAQILTE